MRLFLTFALGPEISNTSSSILIWQMSEFILDYIFLSIHHKRPLSPRDHEVAHGLGGGGVDPVGPVLLGITVTDLQTDTLTYLGVTVTDILKVTADAEPRGAGPRGLPALVKAIL